jgi:hypothetical protein
MVLGWAGDGLVRLLGAELATVAGGRRRGPGRAEAAAGAGNRFSAAALAVKSTITLSGLRASVAAVISGRTCSRLFSMVALEAGHSLGRLGSGDSSDGPDHHASCH